MERYVHSCMAPGWDATHESRALVAVWYQGRRPLFHRRGEQQRFAAERVRSCTPQGGGSLWWLCVTSLLFVLQRGAGSKPITQAHGGRYPVGRFHTTGGLVVIRHAHGCCKWLDRLCAKTCDDTFVPQPSCALLLASLLHTHAAAMADLRPTTPVASHHVSSACAQGSFASANRQHRRFNRNRNTAHVYTFPTSHSVPCRLFHSHLARAKKCGTRGCKRTL